MEEWEEQEEEGHAAGGRCTWGYYNSAQPKSPGPTLRWSYIYTCCKHSVTGIFIEVLKVHTHTCRSTWRTHSLFCQLYSLLFSFFLLLLLLFFCLGLTNCCSSKLRDKREKEREREEEVELFWLSHFQNIHAFNSQ